MRCCAGLVAAILLLLAAPAWADVDGTYIGIAIEGRGRAETAPVPAPRQGTLPRCASTTSAGRDCTAEPLATDTAYAWYGSAPQTLTVTATPAAGWEFAGWTITGEPAYMPYCANALVPVCELRLRQGSTTGEVYYTVQARFREAEPEPPVVPVPVPTVPVPTVPSVLFVPVPGASGDADGDGVSASLDCDDASAAIRPGAVDVPGDGIDQDCSGADATAPPIAALVRYGWDYGPRWSRATQLTVRDLPAGATIALSCRGLGCPFKARTVRGARRTLNLLPRLKRARLRAGAVLAVRITRPGTVGKYLRFTVRRGKAPRLATRCVPLGGGAPRRC